MFDNLLIFKVFKTNKHYLGLLLLFAFDIIRVVPVVLFVLKFWTTTIQKQAQ